MIKRELMQTCEYVLPAFSSPDVGEVLTTLAESEYAKLPSDIYGEGGACSAVVERLKSIFEAPAARFCVKGMIAQMAILRAVVEKSGNNRVAVHRLSHFDYDEAEAVEVLHPIRFLRTGGHHRPFTVDDLDELGELPAVVCVELPLRRAGYRLLPFTELQKISTWCHVHDVHFHIDGARVFGAAAAYDKSLAEISRLCDTLYCSFYKEMGNLGGCGIVGEKAVLEAADVWITRMGGDLPFQFPLAVSALEGLDKHLDQVPNYVAQARKIAALFNQLNGVSTSPVVPHTSGFQVHIKDDKPKIEAALLAMVEREKVWIAGGLYDTALDGVYGFDIEIGSNGMALLPDKWAFHMGKMMKLVRTG
ncbi:threonine aldolase family protein [Maritalea sp.]|uniref:threonine aldolase family protein n=1 Tax=Maritalea sp. TaxID=2003361 RepID=UPI003EF0CF14